MPPVYVCSQLMEEKDCLALQVKKLSLDCEMYQQKSTVIQSQLDGLQEERDQVCQAEEWAGFGSVTCSCTLEGAA